MAALAAAGRGNDAADLSDVEKAKIRQKALDWLKQELAAQAKLFTESSQAAPAVEKLLKHWQNDPDLATVRELGKLPLGEQKAWQSLWADVAALLKKAEAAK